LHTISPFRRRGFPPPPVERGQSQVAIFQCPGFSLGADGDGRFHAPYRVDDASIADGTAAVLLGMYLARVGIDYDTALKYFGHSPHEFTVFARKRPKSDQYYGGSTQ
jgi:hypothetical protein